MAKVAFSNLRLKPVKSVQTFEFEGAEIEVLNYLPISEKNDLIMITLQESEENGLYNPNKLEMYFNLNLVYMYTNLSFTEKQKEEPAKLYDILKTHKFFEKFIVAMPDSEYYYLHNTLNEYMEKILTYRNTAGAVIQSIIQDLPKNAQAAADLVNSFDKEKFKEVVNLANAVN